MWENTPNPASSPYLSVKSRASTCLCTRWVSASCAALPRFFVWLPSLFLPKLIQRMILSLDMNRQISEKQQPTFLTVFTFPSDNLQTGRRRSFGLTNPQLNPPQGSTPSLCLTLLCTAEISFVFFFCFVGLFVSCFGKHEQERLCSESKTCSEVWRREMVKYWQS